MIIKIGEIFISISTIYICL